VVIRTRVNSSRVEFVLAVSGVAVSSWSTRGGRRQVAALSVVAGAALVLPGCGSPHVLALDGHVDDRVVVVQAPILIMPMPSGDGGQSVASRSTAQASPGPSGTLSPVVATTGLGSWNRVDEVWVRGGQLVRAGQILVRFDDSPLRAGMALARADAVVAASQVPVLDSAIDDTYDKQHDVDKALATIGRAIDQLSVSRSRLSGQLSQARIQLAQLQTKRRELAAQRRALRTKLDQVERQLSALRAGLAQLPAQPPGAPPLPARTQILTSIGKLETADTQLRAGLTKLDRARAQLQVGADKLGTGIPKLERAIVTLDRGLDKARNQQSTLRNARHRLVDARAGLRRTRKLAVIAAEAARAGIDVARNQLRQATVTAPAAGVVVDIVSVGQLLAPGAAVTTIREDVGPTVTSWLAPDQLATVCQGTHAQVFGDWMPPGQRASATVTHVGQRADFPPTSFATDEVHLTRAVPVTLSIQSTANRPALPPGAPVEVTIQTASGCPGVATDPPVASSSTMITTPPTAHSVG
jgi:multidrug efflux pump subunit AcrA (membrane-fusion protein)